MTQLSSRWLFSKTKIFAKSPKHDKCKPWIFVKLYTQNETSPNWRFRSLSPSCSFGRYHQISLRKISVNIRVIPVNIRVISPDITMSTHGYNLENANHIHLSMDFVYVSMLVDISSNIRSTSVNIRVISLSGWYQDGQARLEARCEYFSPFLFSFYTL